MHIKFKKLVFDPKKGLTLEFVSPRIDQIDKSHIITLHRPKVDEDDIKEIVARRYTELMAQGLFTAESQKEMDNTVKGLIKESQIRIDSMPNPILFLVGRSEVKDCDLGTNFKFFINEEVATYFIHNGLELAAMIFTLHNKPITFTRTEKEEIIQKLEDDFVSANTGGVSLLSEKDIEHM